VIDGPVVDEMAPLRTGGEETGVAADIDDTDHTAAACTRYCNPPRATRAASDRADVTSSIDHGAAHALRTQGVHGAIGRVGDCDRVELELHGRILALELDAVEPEVAHPRLHGEDSLNGGGGTNQQQIADLVRQIVPEAIKQYVEREEWFIREVEKGAKAADAGRLLDHAKVKAKWEAKRAAQMD